ncbi:host attachment protein, partial [Sphingomonas sanguinis]
MASAPPTRNPWRSVRVIPAHRRRNAMQVPHNSFVLVVDGRKSLFFRNDGDAEYPNLIVEQAVEHSNPADHDQKTDR